MISDMEQSIRQALQTRVEHVTPDQLRYPTLPESTTRRARRSRWTLAAPLLAAACVALIAVAISATTSGGGTKGPAAGNGPGDLRFLVGTSWTLTSVEQDGHVAVTVPGRLGASVTFDRGGMLSAYDGLNEYRSTYRLVTADKLLVGPATSTAAGYVGHDPARLAAINGIGAMFRASDQRNSPQAISAHRHAGRLVLAASGYTLVLGSEAPVAATASR